MSLDFREGGGLTLRDSANPVRTVTINATASTTWGPCKNGVGLLKSATSGAGYITLSPAMPNFTSAFSVETLIQLTAVSGYQTIIVNSLGQDGVWIHAGKIDLYNGTDHDGTATLAAGKWYHVVVTYDGGTGVVYYLNGVKDASVSETPAAVAPSAVLDWSGDGSESLNGKMEYLRYWSRPLSAVEVQSLYTNPYVMFEGTPNVVARLLVSPPAAAGGVRHKVVQN